MIVKGSIGVRDERRARTGIITALVARLGGKIGPIDDTANCDMFVQWGINRSSAFRQHIKEGLVSIALDRGYFDETRFKKFSISVQGVHGLSMQLPTVLDRPPRDHPELQPWKEEGDFIQIVAPGWSGEHWRTPAARLPEGWVQETAATASAAFGLPSKIRYHPRALPRGMRKSPPLDRTFEETRISVSYMSLTAVQTVVAGIPTVVMHPRSVAFPMAAPDMQIVTPDREAWIHDLSHREYYPDEIEVACDYIQAAYKAAKAAGPLKSPLMQYGIKGEQDG